MSVLRQRGSAAEGLLGGSEHVVDDFVHGVARLFELRRSVLEDGVEEEAHDLPKSGQLLRRDVLERSRTWFPVVEAFNCIGEALKLLTFPELPPMTVGCRA